MKIYTGDTTGSFSYSFDLGNASRSNCEIVSTYIPHLVKISCKLNTQKSAFLVNADEIGSAYLFIIVSFVLDYINIAPVTTSSGSGSIDNISTDCYKFVLFYSFYI